MGQCRGAVPEICYPGVIPTGFWLRPIPSKCLLLLARPKRFELLTPRLAAETDVRHGQHAQQRRDDGCDYGPTAACVTARNGIALQDVMKTEDVGMPILTLTNHDY